MFQTCLRPSLTEYFSSKHPLHGTTVGKEGAGRETLLRTGSASRRKGASLRASYDRKCTEDVTGAIRKQHFVFGFGEPNLFRAYF